MAGWQTGNAQPSSTGTRQAGVAQRQGAPATQQGLVSRGCKQAGRSARRRTRTRTRTRTLPRTRARGRAQGAPGWREGGAAAEGAASEGRQRRGWGGVAPCAPSRPYASSSPVRRWRRTLQPWHAHTLSVNPQVQNNRGGRPVATLGRPHCQNIVLAVQFLDLRIHSERGHTHGSRPLLAMHSVTALETSRLRQYSPLWGMGGTGCACARGARREGGWLTASKLRSESEGAVARQRQRQRQQQNRAEHAQSGSAHVGGDTPSKAVPDTLIPF